ncbi:MAG: hypothetical protein JWL62_1085 [Hyphomicrobiales bacterium]|nr:hypothetical protein [Hyphomicrobiales bacterium]
MDANQTIQRRPLSAVQDKAALLIILASTLLRLAASALTGFGNDEAYPLAISRRLDLS